MCASARPPRPPRRSPSLPRLVYRVDAGPRIGLGHLTRAIAITDALAGRGWSVTWASVGGEYIRAGAESVGAFVVTLRRGESEGAFLRRVAVAADCVVLDRKLPYSRRIVAALRAGGAVVVLDVECQGMFTATATVFPTAHMDPALAADPRWGSGRLCHGAPWVVIHPQVGAARTAPRLEPSPAKVAVTTGGSDPADVASRALEWLERVPGDFAVDVLVGTANRRRAALAGRARRAPHATELVVEPEEFPPRLAGATLAVATFGVTAYELAYLGVPAVLVSHDRENAAAAARFARWGTAENLGLATDVDAGSAAAVIAHLLSDRDMRAAMGAAGRGLVDGRGAERVAELVEHLGREHEP